MILICYDGSEDAREAIGQAATLMPGHPALALTVWSSAEACGNGDATDARLRAETTAADGARRAHQAGIDCVPRIACHTGSVADAILEEARRTESRAIVAGRGGGGSDPTGGGLGPVATALLHGATCAVLVAGAAREADALAGRAVRTGALK
jgi:nucleotide-binding universal stress UspA family protein